MLYGLMKRQQPEKYCFSLMNLFKLRKSTEVYKKVGVDDIYKDTLIDSDIFY